MGLVHRSRHLAPHQPTNSRQQGSKKRPIRGVSNYDSMIVLFNGLLLAWVLLDPYGERISAIVLNAAGFVGPLLVLPLCFGGLLEWMQGRGATRTDDQPAAMRGRRWAPVLLGMGILCYVLEIGRAHV